MPHNFKCLHKSWTRQISKHYWLLLVLWIFVVFWSILHSDCIINIIGYVRPIRTLQSRTTSHSLSPRKIKSSNQHRRNHPPIQNPQKSHRTHQPRPWNLRQSHGKNRPTAMYCFPNAEVETSDPNGPFLKTEFNRDGDSYRSPLSNKYFPESEGYLPQGELRRIEEIGNVLFA